MKLIDRIDRKPGAVAIGMRRGAGGGASDGANGGGLSVLRNSESVSLVTPSGTTALPAATASIAGVLGASDKAKLDGLSDAATLATPTKNGLMAGADKAKLDGIAPGATADQSPSEMVAAIDTHLGTTSWREGGAGGAGGANLSVLCDAASVTVASEGGSDAVLPAASATQAGVMAAADKAKLDGIAPGAAANPSPADIKAAYESNPDSNAFTDAERTKLAGIEPGATGDRTGAELVAAIDAVLGGAAWQAGGTGEAGGAAGTNLSVTRDASSLRVLSDTGDDAVLPAASGTEAGVMSAADKAKLDGLSGQAAGDMAGAVYDPHGVARDAFDRANHTGQQAIATVSGLQAALEGKAPNVHEHTAQQIVSGTLLHERGGLEADVSAYNGLIKISAGATSQAVPGTDYAAAAHMHTQAQVTGLGTADSPHFAGLNIGHATDTTITRASPGQIAVEGVNVAMAGHTHAQASIAGLTASDSPQFAAINLGHAADTTLARSAAGQVTIEGVPVLTAANAAVVTNKSIDAAQLTGTIPVARFNGGTGASASTYLRGDGTWAAPAGGSGTGNVSKVGTPAANRMAYWTGDGTLGHEDGFAYDPATDTLTVAKLTVGGITFDGQNQLADPEADRLIGWDESGGTAAYFAAAGGLEISGTEIRMSENQRTTAIQFVIDGGGSAITPGTKGFIEVPFNGTITAARLLADKSGSAVIDIWKDSYANHPPSDADSITGTAPLAIASASKSEHAGLTGWTTSISAGDILAFNVDSASTVTLITVALTVVVS